MLANQPGPDRDQPVPDRLALIKDADLSSATAQTAGMVRTAAISGDLVGARELWMGRTTLPAGVNSGDHHHGESETGIYVVSGRPVFVFRDPDSEELVRLEAQPGDYIWVPPNVRHREENPSADAEAVVVIARSTQEAIVINVDSL
ncbi:MAG TPA: cupin domain-containing protein [Streptosporangiaceae bacterium]